MKQERSQLTWNEGFYILFVIALFGFFILGSSAIYYKDKYQSSTWASLELLKTNLGFLDVCMDLNNITIEEISDLWLDEEIERIKNTIKLN